MVSIRSFIDKVKAEKEKPDKAVFIDWPEILSAAGYHRADLNDSTHWKEVHIWCVEEFGQENYAWSGNIFWFQTNEAATWFTLKWS